VRVTIIGGGGFRVPLICRELAASGLPVTEVVLQDISRPRLDVIASVLARPGLPLTTTTDLDQALEGARVVFCVPRFGGLDGRVGDERAPLDLGLIGQETVGAGGLLYAARAVPFADAMARRIAAVAGGAWVITMTNPAGVITEAMAATLGPRVIGVCDSPLGLVRRACAALDVDPGQVQADYLGLNHLGWLRRLVLDGTDLLPGLVADPQRLMQVEEGRLFGPDLVRALGALPNEYLYWYYAEREALHDVLAAGRTRGEHVRSRQREFYAAAAADPARAAGLWAKANEERNGSYLAEIRPEERAAADKAAGGYETIAVALAQILTGGGEGRLILNVPSSGTMPGLPADAVIETACRVDASGAVPLPRQPASQHELGLMCQVKDCERAVIRAARTGSPDAMLRAFALHPLVGSLPAARELSRAALAGIPA
jgi:6-phospho-beta-glucosidase